jgi:hypothetical protein
MPTKGCYLTKSSSLAATWGALAWALFVLLEDIIMIINLYKSLF